MQATGLWYNSAAGEDQVYCQLQKGAVTTVDVSEPWLGFSMHRIVPISAADNPNILNGGQAINLVCEEKTGTASVAELHISATYYPTSYKPRTITSIPLP